MSVSRHASPVSAALRQHTDAVKRAFNHLLQTPVAALLTILSIAIALALPGSVFSVLDSVSGLGDQWKQGREVSVFLKTRTSDAQISQLKAAIEDQKDVEHVRVISSREAIKELETHSGASGLLDLLGDHALPAVLVVTPSDHLNSVEDFERLTTTIEQRPHIDSVVLDQDWVAKMLGTVNALKHFALLVSVLFGLVVVLMISTAMRHAVLQQRMEIEVTKLVGGSDPFILRPFLYRAAIIGAVSGIIAIILIKLALISLQGPLSQLTGLYARPLNSSLKLDTVFSVVALGTFVSVVSAWITVQLELNKIEPR